MGNEIVLLVIGLFVGALFTLGAIWINSWDDEISIEGIGRFVRVDAEQEEAFVDDGFCAEVCPDDRIDSCCDLLVDGMCFWEHERRC